MRQLASIQLLLLTPHSTCFGRRSALTPVNAALTSTASSPTVFFQIYVSRFRLIRSSPRP